MFRVGSEIKKTLGVCLAFGCALSVAGEREKNAVADTAALLARPKSVKAEDATYREYFGGRDLFIESEFQKRWKLPANRVAMGERGTQTENRFQTVQERVALREEFARMVMRVRLESAVNQYLASRENTSSLKKAHNALNTLKHQKVAVGKSGERSKSSPWEVQFGYNFFTDYSRIELVKGGFRIGVHHAALLSDLTGPSADAPRLNVSTSLGVNAPTAWAGYTLGGDTFQTGLTKHFAPALVGQIYSYQPTTAAGTERYGVQLNYTF